MAVALFGVGLIESPYQYNEKVQNSLMSSSAKHRFWNYTFDALVNNFVYAKEDILKSTGLPCLIWLFLRQKRLGLATMCSRAKISSASRSEALDGTRLSSFSGP